MASFHDLRKCLLFPGEELAAEPAPPLVAIDEVIHAPPGETTGLGRKRRAADDEEEEGGAGDDGDGDDEAEAVFGDAEGCVFVAVALVEGGRMPMKGSEEDMRGGSSPFPCQPSAEFPVVITAADDDDVIAASPSSPLETCPPLLPPS